MQASNAEQDSLTRLAGVDAGGHPVLSVYVDLDPRQYGTPDARTAQLDALAAAARREAREAGIEDSGLAHDIERVHSILDDDPELVHGAHGLAVFSAAAAGLFETVQLAVPVGPLAAVDMIPWLEPLVAVAVPGRFGVAVVGRGEARLLVGNSQTLSEFAAIDDDLHKRHAQGGWSQKRYQRGIEEQVAAHVRHAADLLFRAHERRPFDGVVLVAAAELLPQVESSLHADLKARLTGTVDANLEHAPVDEVLEAVTPLIAGHAQRHQRELLDRFEQSLGKGGRAAAGLDEVLGTLAEERVDTLLIASGAKLSAMKCDSCGRLTTAAVEACPVDGGALFEVDAAEHAVESAERQSATVVLIEDDAAELDSHGSIAALLRW